MFEPKDRTIHSPYATAIMVAIGVWVVSIFSAAYQVFIFLERIVRQVSVFSRRVGLFEAARKK